MKIIHSKKIFIQVKNGLSPRAITNGSCIIRLPRLNGQMLEYCGRGKSLIDVGLAQAKTALCTRFKQIWSS